MNWFKRLNKTALFANQIGDIIYAMLERAKGAAVGPVEDIGSRFQGIDPSQIQGGLTTALNMYSIVNRGSPLSAAQTAIVMQIQQLATGLPNSQIKSNQMKNAPDNIQGLNEAPPELAT